MKIRKRIRKIRSKYFPTRQELIVRQWWADGGDYALRFDYDLDAGSVVLDLGGYEGQWASDLFSRYACNIFVFEPVLGFAERIEQRFRHNPQISVHPYGLGASSRQEIIHLAANGSSLFGTSENREEIRIVDARAWLEEKQIGEIDLLKVNIEGGEYELLPRLIESHLVERIRHIQVQFHNVAPSSRAAMEQIRQELAKTHRPTYQYEFVWENWTRK